MVYRIYVEKKPGFDVEAQQLKNELCTILGIKGLTGLRLVNRYDVEGISRELFEHCVPTVFSEPQVDIASEEPPRARSSLRWSIFPASLTSGPIRPASASSSSARASGPRCAAPRSMCSAAR